MIATFVMTGEWIELPIDLWIEKEKIADRITEKTWAIDWFGALYNSLCITADMDNAGSILVSDYTEANQVNDGTRADYIELQPSGELMLPWSKQVQALNRPFVMWEAWDVVKVVAR